MKIFVGTSGWSYSWNEDGTLDWYVKNSGLNAVELNMSFYRFPTESQIKRWSRYNSIRWVVKVNRKITHIRRLNDMQEWYNFYDKVKLLNPDFYLFQLPPSFKRNDINQKRVEQFSEILGEKMAVEFRDQKWYIEPINIRSVLVSIDSPIGTYIVNSMGYVYLRLHGRDSWYYYDYSEQELRQLSEKIVSLDPEYVYIFFNNDHWMLENARTMFRIMKEFS
ncbi:MAG: DUF72 domain-containing protein [Saccharolobus sp.]